MNVKAWEPAQPVDRFRIDPEVLREFIRLAEHDRLDQLASSVPAAWQTSQRPLMTLNRESWTTAAEQLSDDDLVHLVRFFTVAESQLEGWDSGEQSPVIWLVKVLRKRKAPPSRELLLWIRANSDNRFLPNGPL